MKTKSCLRQLPSFAHDQADNTFLPFALLAANTFLPFFVLILALKPCTLDLDLFLGWNVIFIKRHLLTPYPLVYPSRYLFFHENLSDNHLHFYWPDSKGILPQSENIAPIILKMIGRVKKYFPFPLINIWWISCGKPCLFSFIFLSIQLCFQPACLFGLFLFPDGLSTIICVFILFFHRISFSSLVIR